MSEHTVAELTSVEIITAFKKMPKSFLFLILFSIRVITPASRATEPNEFAKLNEFTPFALKL